MNTRYSTNPEQFSMMNTQDIRYLYLIEELFNPGEINLTYSDIDRVIIGGIQPKKEKIELSSMEELKADYFCQQREVGILNIGGKGTITVDGKEYQLSNLDCLYIGRSSKKITFQTTSQEKPALFYLLSYPAHKKFPTQLAKIKDAEAVHIGSQNESNERTIYKFVHPNGIQSCQLVMGITLLKPGSVWNTMPCHNHKRRMEVYLYFNMDENSRVFHFCGMPNETRHIVLKKNEAVISPSWSIHSGVGTGAYAFCWGMGGENQDFSDMNHIPMDKLR